MDDCLAYRGTQTSQKDIIFLAQGYFLPLTPGGLIGVSPMIFLSIEVAIYIKGSVKDTQNVYVSIRLDEIRNPVMPI